MKQNAVLDAIRGGLIVSCQVLEGEPLYTPDGGIMPLLAKAAQEGGAVAIRANSIRDIRQIREVVRLPMIGLIKKQYPPQDQYITVTEAEVEQLVETGVEIIALDCTHRPRVDGRTVPEFLRFLRERYPCQLFMADIATLEEGVAAAKAGADLVGTTLNGYTPHTAVELSNGPNFGLVKSLREGCGDTPIIAEGRIHYPWEAKKMLDVGAHSVVVGGAITRPLEITRRFTARLEGKA